MSRTYIMDEAVYTETVKLMRGESRQSDILALLADWMDREYGVRLVNIQFSKTSPRLPYRLLLIVPTTDDSLKLTVDNQLWKFDLEKYERIAAEFERLALGLKYATEAQLEKLWVRHMDFTVEAQTVAAMDARDESEAAIKAMFPDVWKFAAWFRVPVVFYLTDADVELCGQDGTSHSLTDLYYSILQKYDVLGYFKRESELLKFDSKENLDKNYKGSLEVYFR